MRVRNRPGAAEYMAKYPQYVVEGPENGKENGKNVLAIIIPSTLKLVQVKVVLFMKWLKHILKLIILVSICN